MGARRIAMMGQPRRANLGQWHFCYSPHPLLFVIKWSPKNRTRGSPNSRTKKDLQPCIFYIELAVIQQTNGVRSATHLQLDG